MAVYYKLDDNDRILMSTINSEGYNQRSRGSQICNGKKVVLQDNPFILEVDDAYNLFYGCTGIENLEYLDISACTNLSNMFARYNNVDNTTLDLSWLDVSNATNFSGMFTSSSIKKLNLTSWNVSGVRNFDYMFYMCNQLQNIYVDPGTDWKTATGGGVSSTYMFNGCQSLPNYNPQSYELNIDYANSQDGYFTVEEHGWFEYTPYIKENGIWVPVEVYA